MLVLGPPTCIPTNGMHVYCFNVYINNIPSLGINHVINIPMEQFTDQNFDIAYMNFIFQNNEIFIRFFKLIMELYDGNDVYLVCDLTNGMVNLPESLVKLIQLRYGYISCIINEPEDWYSVSNGTFDMNGLNYYAEDRTRYYTLMPNELINSVLTQND